MCSQNIVIRFDSIDVPTGQRCAGITQHVCHGERRQSLHRHCVASNYVTHFARLDSRTYMKPNYAARLIRSKHTQSLRCQNTVASNYVSDGYESGITDSRQSIFNPNLIIIGLQLSNFVSASNGDYPAKSCLVSLE